MPADPPSPQDAVERASGLAEEFAPELVSVLFTLYPDADTFDTMNPGAGDVATATAADRAAAAVLAAAGVKVFVQHADRAAFRRWIDERGDTPEARLAWRNRGGLLSGADALRALGLDPGIARPRRAGRGSGSPADRLVRAFVDDDPGFVDLVDQMLEAGKEGVFEVAIRKTAERFGEEAAGDLAQEFLTLAEGADIGPSGWAELVALPVALQPGELPDAAAMGESLVASGILEETVELRFLPGWRSPEALASLGPVALRRTLLDLVAGREPTAVPPAGHGSLAAAGFGVLLGLQLDWAIRRWEDVVANGVPPETEEEDEPQETPEQAESAAMFGRWRTAVFDLGGGCVPLGLVPVTEVSAEIADFLDEAGIHTDGLDEIREFIAVARREAGEEEVVCLPEVAGEALEIRLYTRGGRLLDSLTLPDEQLPVPAAEMPRLLEAFIPLVKDVPGRPE